jgi:hypothetical protein
VIIRSNKNKASIEHIRDMNRLMQSYFQCSAGKQDGISHLNTAALVMPNFEVARTDTLSTTGEDFSIHIPTGLLNGTGSIPLSSDYGIGGCELTIMLAPDCCSFLF